MGKLFKNKYILTFIALIVGLIVGWLLRSPEPTTQESLSENKEAISAVWTCSMHPQIRQPESGDCPICGMDLIQLADDTETNMDPNAVSMSPTAMKLANIVTAKVGNAVQTKTVELNGTVQADERLIYSQTSHISGRVEELNINFTGEFVRRGQVIAYLYSPALVTAQEELIEVKKIKESQPVIFEAAKEKLSRWKLSNRQIDELISSEKVKVKFPITADVSGYVLEKNVKLGDYIEIGTPLYTISDLTRVWVMLDLYETDLATIQTGDRIDIKVNALNNKLFEGKIDFIDPTLNANTRVAQARVVVKNKGNMLKPGMYVSATIQAKLNTENDRLTVPKSAVMWTGKRSVVYVKQSSTAGISFQMREIELGEVSGDRYLIKEGLQAGEEIAVNGAFSIDAAAQLAGKPSMMNREASIAYDISGQLKEQLNSVLSEYLALKNSLVADDLAESKATAKLLIKQLESVSMEKAKPELSELWNATGVKLKTPSNQIVLANNLKDARKNFMNLSQEMIVLLKELRWHDSTIYVQHCPMADSNKGADWLSEASEIRNPYFGASMLNCGEVITTL